jgi:hypothetical protein
VSPWERGDAPAALARRGQTAITKFFSATAGAVTIVRPETVIGWHRSLWKIIWTRRSRHRIGRPPSDADTRALIRRLRTENPLWGENQIAAQLARFEQSFEPRASQEELCDCSWSTRPTAW